MAEKPVLLRLYAYGQKVLINTVPLGLSEGFGVIHFAIAGLAEAADKVSAEKVDRTGTLYEIQIRSLSPEEKAAKLKELGLDASGGET